MNKFLYFLFCIFVFNGFLAAQSMVSGYVTGVEGKPVNEAVVTLSPGGNSVKTDRVGYYQFKDVASGTYTLIIENPNYHTYQQVIQVTNTPKIELAGIKLDYDPTNTQAGIITLTEDELTTDESSNAQSGIGLLQASRDVFSRNAAFVLGSYWFRPRGLDNSYNEVLFNGVSMSNQENGRVDFSSFGGLNDVTRYPYEIADSNNPSEFTFGNLGGVVYQSTRASDYRKGTSLSYALTNRSYRNRLMLTHSTGMMKNGWAITVSGSRRWANEGYFDGTYQDRYAYFAAIEKKTSDKHSINFTAFGTPGRIAGNSPNTQYVWDLMGKKYNAYWGYQDGEVRNERIRKTFQPVFQLTNYIKLSENTKLVHTLSYQFGKDSRSRLDWFNAGSPSPTYYRNLPNYFLYRAQEVDGPGTISTEEQANLNFISSLWQNNNTIVTQIFWDGLYLQNQNISENSETNYGYANLPGKRAAYYLVNDVVDEKIWNKNLHLSSKLSENWKLFFNFNYLNYKSENYREVNDLLGADFALNANDFEQDTPKNAFYNLDDPTYVAREGDKIEYSYTLKRHQYTGNLSTEINISNFSVWVSTFLSYTESRRNGEYRNYLSPTQSQGESALYNRMDGGIKARINYKIDGRNFLQLNSGFYTLTPNLNDIFSNPRNNNLIIPNLESQRVTYYDLSYIIKSPKLKSRLSGYYTKITHATDLARYYLEGTAGTSDFNFFVTDIITDLEKEYIGGELGIEYKITPSFITSAVASVGQFTIKNDPHLYQTSDGYEGIKDYGKAALKNYYLAGTPQKAFMLEFRYSSPKFWWIGVSGNYLMDNYVDINYQMRTQSFITDITGAPYYTLNQQSLEEVLRQQKFSDEFFLNLNAGKSFKFGKYRLGISANINNLLNNKNYITGGYESGRFGNYPEALDDYERGNNRLFGNKLWYGMGISYFINTYLRF